MMKIRVPSLFAFGFACTFATFSFAGESLETEARTLAAEFIGQLKPLLKSALQEGGPVNAIEVCSHEAPKLADSLAAESGWLVRRVSLKSRNASRAIPDPWETDVLNEFNRRQQAGESPAQINYSETTPSHFRYMQAQGVDGVCLTCHGQHLSQEVTDVLQKYYPDDIATGYSIGQIRGAISLTRPL